MTAYDTAPYATIVTDAAGNILRENRYDDLEQATKGHEAYASIFARAYPDAARIQLVDRTSGTALQEKEDVAASLHSLDLFDAASYHEPSMDDVVGAYEARLHAAFDNLGRVTRQLEEEGYRPHALFG